MEKKSSENLVDKIKIENLEKISKKIEKELFKNLRDFIFINN